MLTRRDLFKYGAVTGATAMLPLSMSGSKARAEAAQMTASIPGQFTEPLPIPPVQEPVKVEHGVTIYEVPQTEFKQFLGFHNAQGKEVPTTVWGYNGRYLGKTIIAFKNKPVKIRFINDLPTRHILPVDESLHGAMGTPAVRTVVHLHGGRVKPENDGFPEDWIVRGQTQEVFYPNIQRATFLWYHDHALGVTRLNVYAGLAAAYILRDPEELALNIPKGPFEVPLVIQDKSFNPDGSLFYPSTQDPADVAPGFPPIPFPSVVPEFFGDRILVNGMTWPFLEVEPRKYRLRFLNGSNARFYRLRFSNGMPLVQIGNEGGLFEKPVALPSILLAPAERADVIADFSRHKGDHILLTNDAAAPFPTDDLPDPATTGRVMKFKVTLPLSSKDRTVIPAHLSHVPLLSPRKATVVRNLTLDETVDEFGRLLQLLTNSAWDDPITEKPKLGATEIWQLINLTADTRPIHLHLVNFQVLNRQAFDVDKYMTDKQLVFTGPVEAPTLNEQRGMKDTVKVPPEKVTRIIAQFGPFKGVYPWHCHILEHEDHDMMRPYEVV